MSLRVLLVDDEQLVREGLRLMLEAVDDLEVVADTGSGDEAVTLASQHRPQVALVDVRMPGTDGITTARLLRALPDPPAVVMLTTFDTDEYVHAALAAGACGFLLKDTPPTRLIDSIRVAAGGQAVLAPTVTRRLVDTTIVRDGERRRRAREELTALTERELDVLALIARGYSNAEVGAALFLGEATVKTHVSRILAKTGLSTRVQIAIIGHDAELGTD